MVMSDLPEVYVFGAGHIGLHHAAAFEACGANVTVISQAGGRRVSQEIEYDTVSIQNLNKAVLRGQGVVIALPISKQVDLLESVVLAAPKFVLLEKPGSFHLSRLEKVVNKIEFPVYIAYNRRFLTSVRELISRLRLAKVYSIKCDASENLPRLMSMVTDKHLLNNWHLANSMHVLDLSMHISRGNSHDLILSRSSGCASFGDIAGGALAIIRSGQTEIIYTADFRASGSWNIEVISSVGRFRLGPLEELKIFNSDTFSYSTIVDKSVESVSKIKPGFLDQAKACLNDFNGSLIDLRRSIEVAKLMQKIYRPNKI